MFKLAQSNSYKWPVAVELPADGGRMEKHTFDAEFKRLPQSRIKALTEQVKSGDLTDADFVKEVLVGWKGVLDESGQEVPFSEGTRDALIDVQLVSGALVGAFFESLTGGRRKN